MSAEASVMEDTRFAHAIRDLEEAIELPLHYVNEHPHSVPVVELMYGVAALTATILGSYPHVDNLRNMEDLCAWLDKENHPLPIGVSREVLCQMMVRVTRRFIDVNDCFGLSVDIANDVANKKTKSVR